MQLDYTQAKYHCELISGGDTNALHYFQIYYDVRGSVKRPDLAQNFVSTLDQAWPRIQQAQQNHCGIFITMNVTDGTGRNDRNIIKFRAVFVDYDNQEKPNWLLEPSVETARDSRHGHAVWLIADGEIDNAADYSAMQKRLALCYDTDQSIVNPGRVLRVAGTPHYKDFPVTSQYVVTAAPNHLYTLAHLTDAHILGSEKDLELRQFITTRAGVQTGIGYEHSERYNAVLTKWVSEAAPVAVEHQDGDSTLLKVAGYAHDRGIPLPEAQQILWEHYNPRCEPPWSAEQQPLFDQTIEHSYNYARSVAGCKTAKAEFTALGAIPEPIGGWEANSKINDPVVVTAPKVNHDGEIIGSDRLDKPAAEVLLGNLDLKSSHYDLARAFDGIMYNGVRLIRSEKTFYISNLRCYDEIADEVIKSMIQKFYFKFKPADSFVRGVLASLSDLVHVTRLKNGMWLSDPYRDGSHVMVFKNGTVDLSKTPHILETHTHDFFTRNQVDYNWVIGATCPVYDSFVRSAFPNDEKMIQMLLEWFGYCMTPSIDLQKFALWIGLPRTGKGVLAKILTLLVGMENVCSPTLASITKDGVLHTMANKKVALIPDAHNVAKGLRDSVISMLKAITGGDAQSYHVMYKGVHTSYITSKFTMSTNGMPDFPDPSGALSHRMLAFTFNESFAGKEDFALFDKLEKEIEGIAQKAVAAYVQLRANGGVFTESDASKLEREDIKEDMFPLAHFVDTVCTLSDDSIATIDELFSAYKFYCDLEGINLPLTKHGMSKMLRNSSLGLKKVRAEAKAGNSVRAFKGIRVTNLPGKFPPVPI